MSVDPPRRAEVLDPGAASASCAARPTGSSCTTWSRSTSSGWCWPPASPAEFDLHDLDGVIEIGASPRATLGLAAAARAMALMQGRDYVLPQDVRAVAVDVMAHRLVLTFDAIADGVDPRHVSTGSIGLRSRRRGRSGRSPPEPVSVSLRPGPADRAGRRAGRPALASSHRSWRCAGWSCRSSDGSTASCTASTSDCCPVRHGLAEARLYVPGEDDVRRMDWAVTARTTVPHVRDVIADRELETWALVDLSPSMHFGTAALEKRDLAVAAVATMAS